MKTQNELQQVVDEIRAVCKKHGLVLIGTCDDEGTWGEIAIGEFGEIAKHSNGVENRITNEVTPDFNGTGFKCIGIGEVEPQSPST